MAVLVFHCRKSTAQEYFARYLQSAVGVTDKMPQWDLPRDAVCLSLLPHSCIVSKLTNLSSNFILDQL